MRTTIKVRQSLKKANPEMVTVVSDRENVYLIETSFTQILMQVGQLNLISPDVTER